MRRPAVLVVAGWATANVVLTLVLIGYGEGAFGVLVFVAGNLLAAIAAGAVTLANRRRPGQRREYRLPSGEGTFALPLVITVVAVVVSAVYTAWLLPLAVPPAVLTAVLAVREHRSARRR